MLEFKHKEVQTWVGGLVQVFKTDLTDEIDVLTGFCTGQRLRSADAVLQFKRGDAGVVLNGVAHRWVEQDGVGKTVDTAGRGQACIHADGLGVIPRGVDTEVPGDFLAVGDIGIR